MNDSVKIFIIALFIFGASILIILLVTTGIKANDSLNTTLECESKIIYNTTYIMGDNITVQNYTRRIEYRNRSVYIYNNSVQKLVQTEYTLRLIRELKVCESYLYDGNTSELYEALHKLNNSYLECNETLTSLIDVLG